MRYLAAEVSAYFYRVCEPTLNFILRYIVFFSKRLRPLRAVVCKA